MKKKWTFAASAAALCVLFSACSSMPNLVKEPALSFGSVIVKGINFDGVNMLAVVNIKNENAFSIPFPEINWALFMQEKLFINGVIKYDTSIAAKSTTPVEIPFTVYYEGLYSVVKNLLNADEAPYRIDLGAVFSIPVLGNKRFNTQFSGKIPLAKAPSLSFAGVRFTTLSLTRVDFVLTWFVENKNAFNISLDRLNYDFSINGASWAKGAAPQKLSLPAKKTSQIPVTISLSSLSMARDIFTMAQGGGSAAFKCSGEAALRPELAGLEALTLPFNFSGTTNFGR